MKVLFVCLGNFCRSPMAEAIFRQMVRERGLEGKIEVDSAGLGGWHAGERPHHGTLEILNRNQISHDGLRSRLIQPSDLQDFEYIVAMDDKNIQGLQGLGVKSDGQVFRLLDLVHDITTKNVPDPYHTGNFDEVYQLIHVGCERLLDKIIGHMA